MSEIKRNRIKCLCCNDIIESEKRWHFKLCKCGRVAVEGGKDYLKRSGEPSDWEEMSE